MAMSPQKRIKVQSHYGEGLLLGPKGYACMHAGAPLSWKPVTPEEKMQKNQRKITHICMHACMLGAPLSGKPVTPEEKMLKNPRKITHICVHACMLGHPSAGSR